MLSILLALAIAAEPHTVEEITELCPTFTSKEDKQLCEKAADEVAKLKTGVSEEVGLFLGAVDTSGGQVVLSRKRAKHMRTWEHIQKAEKEDLVLEGAVKKK